MHRSEDVAHLAAAVHELRGCFPNKSINLLAASCVFHAAWDPPFVVLPTAADGLASSTPDSAVFLSGPGACCH